jgi:hypothetical protein
MALLYVPTGVLLSFIDTEGTIGRTGFFLPALANDNANVDDLIAKGATVAATIAAMSDCVLVDRSTIFTARDNAVVGAGEVEKKGIFYFTPAQGSAYRTQVPGFKDSLLDANKRSIAVTGTTPAPKTEVAAFVTALLDGPVGSNNGATNAAGISLDAALSAHKEHESALKERRGRSG